MKKILLASNSPRRKQLLQMIGLKFTIKDSGFDETGSLDLDPIQLVEYLSFQKAQSVAIKHADAVVIGADTVVVLDKHIIGKPKNSADAKRILRKLSNKMHLVITGYTIIDTATTRRVTNSVTSKVFMKKIPEKQIESYVKTGEPLDKAGAYGIQGLGSILINKIEGDYFNVVGLPIKELSTDLERFGVSIL